jgi:hypothetical protein
MDRFLSLAAVPQRIAVVALRRARGARQRKTEAYAAHASVS